MRSLTNNPPRLYLRWVILISGVIALGLAGATHDINFWPSDSYHPYRTTAVRLFDLPYLSAMHEIPDGSFSKINMHGKEALILGIAVMQRLLQDTESLYPNILLLILVVFISSVLIYLIMKDIFDPPTALLAFFLFAACFWPYLYVLQGSHQPMILMSFLLTVFFLQRTRRKIFYFLGGLSFGLMLFSSPTAILYFPYFALGVVLRNEKRIDAPSLQPFLMNALLFLAGSTLTILLFTWPDPFKSLSDLFTFVWTSQNKNHFYFHRDSITGTLPSPYNLGLPLYSFRGAGIPWIFKYFFLIMPGLFCVYLINLFYFLLASRQQRAFLFLIAISLSTPVFVEITQVAQFGRNYFSWIVGIIFLVSYGFHHLKSRLAAPPRKPPAFLIAAGTLFLIFHILFNLRVFLTDVLPTRMATTRVYHWLKKNHVKDVFIYPHHPLNLNTADMLNNPKFDEKINFLPILSIADKHQGFILVPPLSRKTIWSDCVGDDFPDDPQLTKLYASRKISRYAAASFRPVGASRYWNQEEEICTYLDLILGKIDYQSEAQLIYILDAAKLRDGLTPPAKPEPDRR